MLALLSNNPLPNLTKIGILNQIFDNASKTVSNYNRKYRSDKKPLELFYLKQCWNDIENFIKYKRILITIKVNFNQGRIY